MSYLPLLYLVITAVGGCMALANIDPVPAPARPIVIGATSGRGGRPFGTYPPVNTPPGDPALFADVRCQPFTRRPERVIRPRLRSRPCCLPAPATHWHARVA